MRGFSSSFLIFFYQVALGGLFALAATPFQELDRAFYKSTGGVLCLIAILGLWGKSSFYNHHLSTEFSWIVAAELVFHVLFVFFFIVYIVSLWGERQGLRSRCFAGAILSGLAGLVLSAHSFYSASIVSLETILYPVSFFLSALILGSVTVGMLIGHWYLIDTGQSLDPFVRIYKFFVISLIAQSIFLASDPCGDYVCWVHSKRHGFNWIVAQPFHPADTSRHCRSRRAVSPVLDDLAHPSDPAHHGGDRVVLYGATRGIRRRNSRQADTGAELLAILNAARNQTKTPLGIGLDLSDHDSFGRPP